jgi:hypothetical protein
MSARISWLRNPVYYYSVFSYAKKLPIYPYFRVMDILEWRQVSEISNENKMARLRTIVAFQNSDYVPAAQPGVDGACQWGN